MSACGAGGCRGCPSSGVHTTSKQSSHRRGRPHSSASCYTYLIAPAWRIHNVRHAYDAVKYVNVIVMTAAAFPAYGLARFVTGKTAALFAAAAAVLIPAVVYTGLIVEEPLAYPYATLCLFLIAG